MNADYFQATLSRLEREINQIRILTIEDWPQTPGGLRRACVPMAQAALVVRNLLQHHGVAPLVPLATRLSETEIDPELDPYCNLQICQALFAKGQRHLKLVRSLQSVRSQKQATRGPV